MINQPAFLTERVGKCLAAGSVDNLFPLLKDWTQAELRALVEELDASYEASCAGIDEAYGVAAKTPMGRTAAGKLGLDAVRNKYKKDVMIVFSEISSVAQFYLEEKAAVQ